MEGLRENKDIQNLLQVLCISLNQSYVCKNNVRCIQIQSTVKSSR